MTTDRSIDAIPAATGAAPPANHRGQDIHTDEAFWDVVRRAYPRQEPLLNLNNASASPPPLTVENTVTEALRFISRNPDVNMWNHLDPLLPATKSGLALVAGCEPEEIALNRNSTEGLCTAIFGIPLAAGDEVLVSPWDYPSVRSAWLQRQEREGINVIDVTFELCDDDDTEIIRAYASAITSRTRVVQLTHMSHWTGRIFPVRQLCAMAARDGILTVLDAAQTFAQIPLRFDDLGCDYFVTSLHKWLGAPIGNGMLIVRKDKIDSTWPLLAPFDPPPLQIEKFDHWNLGTYNSALQAGIAPAIEFHRSIGIDRIHQRLRELTRYWTTAAQTIPGFTLHTPLNGNAFAAVTLFSIAGIDSLSIERHLRNAHHVHVKYRRVGALEGLRVSPHVYTSKADLDDFVHALQATVDYLR